jgi:hypothetical protein
MRPRRFRGWCWHGRSRLAGQNHYRPPSVATESVGRVFLA